MDGSTPFTHSGRVLTDPSSMLIRIAEALQVPLSAFSRDDTLMPDQATAIELMTLWLSLRNEPARSRVLAAARTAVAAQSD